MYHSATLHRDAFFQVISDSRLNQVKGLQHPGRVRHVLRPVHLHRALRPSQPCLLYSLQKLLPLVPTFTQ